MRTLNHTNKFSCCGGLHVDEERRTFRKDEIDGDKDEIDGHQVVLEGQLVPDKGGGKSAAYRY